MSIELNKNWRRTGPELVIRGGLFLAALLSVFTTIFIVIVLAYESVGFFSHVSLWDFLFGTRWSPLIEPREYGVLPLVCGTMLIVVGSGLIALPIGLSSAIYLSEYASRRSRTVIKPILEILAGIPTVVYGFFALTVVTPFLQSMFDDVGVFNAASAAIVVGIMILPMVISLCDDAIQAVPKSMRHAAYALGATPLEVSTRIVVPGAASGIFAAFVLAVSRAIGETMAVALAAGATPNLTFSPFESIQTMTASIVQIMMGDAPADTLEYQSVFAVAALLFVITLGMNLISNRVMRRFREAYE